MIGVGVSVTWYTSAIATIVCGEVTRSTSSAYQVRCSHLRSWHGRFGDGLQGVFELSKMGWEYDLVNLVKYLPVSGMHILSMTIGYIDWIP